MRRWYLAFTAGEKGPAELPIGVTIESSSAGVRQGQGDDRGLFVALVKRHKLTEAIDVIVATFGGASNPPLVHKARHSPISIGESGILSSRKTLAVLP